MCWRSGSCHDSPRSRITDERSTLPIEKSWPSVRKSWCECLQLYLFLEHSSLTTDDQSQRLRVVPVKDLRSLSIVFPLPNTDEHYLKKPTHYLSHLIGHESQGSLLSLLKKKGLANELTAGASRSSSDLELFKINIKLTDQCAGTHD